MPVQQAVERHARKERIEQLEAQVERLKGALVAVGVPSSHVERIAHEDEATAPYTWLRLGLTQAQWERVDP